MSSISIIGLGNMASALADRALAGGNAVEIIGRDPAKAKELAAALAYGTARMTMSPAGAAPVVPTVAPPSGAANSSALVALRPMISTALPPASAGPAKALAMLPTPMMLMLLMKYPV